MTKFQPKDLIAIVVILSVVFLKFFKIEFNFDPVLTLMLGYYFARRVHGSDAGL